MTQKYVKAQTLAISPSFGDLLSVTQSLKCLKPTIGINQICEDFIQNFKTGIISLENDGRFNLYDCLYFKIFFNCSYPNFCPSKTWFQFGLFFGAELDPNSPKNYEKNIFFFNQNNLTKKIHQTYFLVMIA